ncbi:tRNA (guanosine(37)-N1)-methyltransferase TrmD [Amaricoccus macauensis]|uniref:tRNA (guanosine(37)-N1)-methyltransferase TrmD n=1 Tax=Amaricoccus macauensis TaxID=57001 RepID=UPI003C7E3642
MPAPWTARILTLYPEMFPGPLGASITGRALTDGLWNLDTVQLRDFAFDRHRSVDDTPAGGGAGMVLKPDVAARALDASESGRSREDWPVIYLSPRGRRFDQAMARRIADGAGVTLFCGRFEGLDQRVIEAREILEISMGDFILTGGEIAAMGLIDACVRLIPRVLGNPESPVEESFASGLLEHPQYTRPAVWEGLSIPEVLLSGHHGRIADWRRAQAERITKERRPDLWRAYAAGESPGAYADPAGEAELSDAHTIAAQGEHREDERE